MRGRKTLTISSDDGHALKQVKELADKLNLKVEEGEEQPANRESY